MKTLPDTQALVELSARLATELSIQGDILDSTERGKKVEQVIKNLKSVNKDYAKQGKALAEKHQDEFDKLEAKTNEIKNTLADTKEANAKKSKQFSEALKNDADLSRVYHEEAKIIQEVAPTIEAPTLGGKREGREEE